MKRKENGVHLLTGDMSLFLFLCWPIHPARKDLNAAKAAYEEGNYRAAAQEYIRLAQEGSAEAQYMTGLIFNTGLGVPQDSTQTLT